MKGYFSTLGAVSALLLSSSIVVVNGAGMPKVDQCVADARGHRQEQCGGLRPDSLEYNQCMAHWTDRVLQCFEEGQQSLTPKQQADRMAEEAHASSYQNEIARLSKLAMLPSQQQQQQQRQVSDSSNAHYLIGNSVRIANIDKQSPSERVARMHSNGQPFEDQHQQQHLPVSPLTPPPFSPPPPAAVKQQGPAPKPQPQQNAPAVVDSKLKAAIPGKQAPVIQATAPVKSTSVAAPGRFTTVTAVAEEDDLAQANSNDDVVVGEEIALPTPNTQASVTVTAASAPFTVSARFVSVVSSSSAAAPLANKSAAVPNAASPAPSIKGNIVVVVSESTTVVNKSVLVTTTVAPAEVTAATNEPEADADDIPSSPARAAKSSASAAASDKIVATSIKKNTVASSATSVLKQAETQAAETVEPVEVDADSDASDEGSEAEVTAAFAATPLAPSAKSTSPIVLAELSTTGVSAAPAVARVTVSGSIAAVSQSSMTIAASAIPVAPADFVNTVAKQAAFASPATAATALAATSSGSLAAIVAAQTPVPQQQEQQQQQQQQREDAEGEDDVVSQSPAMLAATTTALMQVNGLPGPTIKMTTIGRAVVPFDANLFGTNGEPAVFPTAETAAEETISAVDADSVDSLTSVAEAGASSSVSSLADVVGSNTILVASTKLRQATVAATSSVELESVASSTDVAPQSQSDNQQQKQKSHSTAKAPTTLSPLGGATAAAHALGVGNTVVGHRQSTAAAAPASTSQSAPARAHMMKNKMGEASSATPRMTAISGIALAVSFAAGIMF
ncbi:hypothetical protein GGI23_000463 [Coemansia sp. RSA 2559]|nr:hypothetical protein GGI23_000463 [Coemansia sp. RSA 2559]KAJ2869377.1 hypothetical protein GGI22_000296 [Coemansia erecta]